MSEDKIKVRVTAVQRIRFNQIREIPAALYATYEAMREAGARDEDFCRQFEDLIDPAAISDVDDYEQLTIEPYRPMSRTLWPRK